MEHESTYIAFAGARRVAAGALPDVLPALKQRFERDRPELVLVFDVETGRQVDFDLRGSLDEVLERAVPTPARGPGRPRLGVTSREVSLMPRHWEWLEAQENGISPALRRLVEEAIKTQPGKERARRIRAALARFLSAIAGDRPNYEEACRALFAGDRARLEALIAHWPRDIREHVLQRATEAAGVRLWSLHPRHLDALGLVVLWREGLLARAVLGGRTTGYRHHPQLERFRERRDPVAAIDCYLSRVLDEARQRGYGFDVSKISYRRCRHGALPVGSGQLEHEWQRLLAKLRQRDRPRWRHERQAVPEAHPCFRVVEGPVADWERP